jgi:HNH endonuclease
MPRGPVQFTSKGACIYCGTTGVKLTDEHIVPYSLGGSHVLRDASCLQCADELPEIYGATLGLASMHLRGASESGKAKWS